MAVTSGPSQRHLAPANRQQYLWPLLLGAPPASGPRIARKKRFKRLQLKLTLFSLHEGVSVEELENVRAHLKQERALGNTTLQAMVGKAPGRTVKLRNRNRPRSPDSYLDGA